MKNVKRKKKEVRKELRKWRKGKSSREEYNKKIVYCATRGERRQFHECEVSCPSEARADITRVKLLPRLELRIQFFITPQVEIRLEMPRVLKGIPDESPMGSSGGTPARVSGGGAPRKEKKTNNRFKRIKINITSITRHETFEVDWSLL